MATFQSLIDGFDAATTPITTDALGMLGSPQFVNTAEVTLPAGGFSAVYAFGDSLSDAGNAWIGTLNTVPVSPPYSDGRFSDGNVWVQDLSQDLGLPPVSASLSGGTDYAYGGAETGATLVHTENPTDMPSQLGQFVASVPDPAPNALYTMWIGSNDVLDIAHSTLTPTQQQQAVTQAVTNEIGSIDGLIAHGAKNLVVLNVPDLGKTPYEMARPTDDAAASSLSLDYDNQLGAALQQVMATGAASIDLVNTFQLLDAVIADPSTYGFTNVTQPLWDGNLTSASSGTLAASGAAANGYLFFDSLHPTAAAQTLLADAVVQSLNHTA
jgi:phospholipase/lecithinase/hemolysin